MEPDNNRNFRHVTPTLDVPVDMIRAFLNWDPNHELKEEMVKRAVKPTPQKIRRRWKCRTQRKVIWTTFMKVAT